jgi:hypothetical protein
MLWTVSPATMERSVIGFVGFIDRILLTTAQSDDYSVVAEVANIVGEEKINSWIMFVHNYNVNYC